MSEVLSIDPKEASYYASLADTWWDHEGPFWPLHRLNGLRTGWIADRAAHHFGRDSSSDRPLAGLEVLDVGCGGGILSEAIAALGARVHGVDVVERNIATAGVHAERTRSTVRYECVAAETLAGRGARYDMVLNMEVVEHVADLAGFMHACNTLVSPGGVHVVSTINRTATSFLFAIIGAEYVLRWLPQGTHQWRRFPRPLEVRALFEADGLRLCERSGVRVDPFRRSFSLTRTMSVNYMLMAAREPSA